MKKIIILLAVIASALFVSCAKDNPNIKSMAFSPDTYTTYPGQNLMPTLVVEPMDADRSKIEWSSSNPDVATVMAGVVLPSAPGMTEITAKYKRLSAKATVYVSDVDITSFSAPGKVQIGVNSSAYVQVSGIVPDYGSVASLDCSIDENKYDGKHFYVSGKDPGDNTITISSRETATSGMKAELLISSKDGSVKRTVAINCLDIKATGIHITSKDGSYDSNTSSYYDYVRNGITLVACLEPYTCTVDPKSLVWEVSNSAVSIGETRVRSYNYRNAPGDLGEYYDCMAETTFSASENAIADITVKEPKSGVTASCSICFCATPKDADKSAFYFYENYDKLTNRLSGQLAANPTFEFPTQDGYYGKTVYIATSDCIPIWTGSLYWDTIKNNDWSQLKEYCGITYTLGGNAKASSKLYEPPLQVELSVDSGEGSITLNFQDGTSKTISAIVKTPKP